ncbi:hypothetical protein HU200_064208 [Digitaria exilis]|uniref:Uncharacterized protein n=1 Tax=Digitaria exilis TaxID=1010633 RepID=A0A835A1V9_9POAL|nr:hypothetical protein HU200_064208 [Digitaria exilis]
MDVHGRIARAISDAPRDPEKLPEALILCGGVRGRRGVHRVLGFRGPGWQAAHRRGDRAVVLRSACYHHCRGFSSAPPK